MIPTARSLTQGWRSRPKVVWRVAKSAASRSAGPLLLQATSPSYQPTISGTNVMDIHLLLAGAHKT